MATEDGYILGRRLAGVDLTDHTAVRTALQDFEEPRRPHTARQSQTTYFLGQLFHHAPRVVRPARDLFLDRSPFLQKVIGESTPGEIIKLIAEIDTTETAFRAVLEGPEAQG